MEWLNSLLTWENALSWTACLLLLYGLDLIADQKKSGFYVALIAEVMWIVWGFLTHSYALVVMSFAISIMYIKAVRKWGKKEKSVNNEQPVSGDGGYSDLP